MKKVGDYRKTLGVTKATELKEIKTIYRGLMKDWHPDKFSADADKHAEAEEKSKEIKDSILYAKRIQSAILTSKEEFNNNTPCSAQRARLPFSGIGIPKSN